MTLRTKAFVALGLLATAILVALGSWQWRRMGEKRDMIAAITRAAAAPAQAYTRATPNWIRVTLNGRYLHDRAAYIRSSRPAPKPGERDSLGGVPISGFGVFVLTPFVYRECPPGRGSAAPACQLRTIYVNRGFLPTEADGRIPAHARPDEPVTVTGFVRPSEGAAILPPWNDPARGVWFRRSIEEMAQAADLFGAQNGEAAAFNFTRFIDREAAPGERAPPFGIEIGEFVRGIPDHHFGYALTWWGLAATNLLVMAFFLFGAWKRDAGR